jgi:transposase
MEARRMSGWNQAPFPRDQILLFRETLGDRIPENHTVRLFGEILDGLDWSSWEQHYVLVAGQPPVHPKIMAGAILYGLTHGLRSSRRLEWACANAVDFLWLVEGRTIDHSTFCDFRTKFKRELKDLFRQIGRVAMHLGLISLNQVTLYGTRVKSNSSPHATASGKTLQERLRVLDEQIEKMPAEADHVGSVTVPAGHRNGRHGQVSRRLDCYLKSRTPRRLPELSTDLMTARANKFAHATRAASFSSRGLYGPNILFQSRDRKGAVPSGEGVLPRAAC